PPERRPNSSAVFLNRKHTQENCRHHHQLRPVFRVRLVSGCRSGSLPSAPRSCPGGSTFTSLEYFNKGRDVSGTSAMTNLPAGVKWRRRIAALTPPPSD